MSEKRNPRTEPEPSKRYHIRIKGHLARRWADWFDGVTITLEDDGVTLLACTVVDQAALHGLLRKVRDLGMPLLSVTRVEPGREDGPDDKPVKGQSP